MAYRVCFYMFPIWVNPLPAEYVLFLPGSFPHSLLSSHQSAGEIGPYRVALGLPLRAVFFRAADDQIEEVAQAATNGR